MNGEPWVAGRKFGQHHRPGPIDFLADLNDQPWAADAMCAQTDPDAFFPEKGGTTRSAKAVCRACPVRAECLNYAIEHQERYGIWGGLSERERRRHKAAPDAPPRPCARVGCAVMIPATAHASKRYHDNECARIANEDRIIAGLDVAPIVAAYTDEQLPIGAIAKRHHLQISLITRILDQHGINHTRALSQARRRARRRVQEAS